jgi:glycosyltransferase involved in cell wall biosynthesis
LSLYVIFTAELGAKPDTASGIRAPQIRMKLSIIVPVFNEEKTLRNIIDRVKSVEMPVEKEIIIVDDCSTDGTAAILDILVSRDPMLKVQRHTVNQGKGAAIRTAQAMVTGDFVVIQDADLEYDPHEIPKLLKPLLDGVADAVYGSRFLGGPHRVLYYWHYVGNKLLTFLTNVLYNVNLSDMETCYKVMRADLFKKLNLTSDRFGIEPQITAQIIKRNARLYEAPISYYGRTYEEGKKIRASDALTAVVVLIQERFKP